MNLYWLSFAEPAPFSEFVGATVIEALDPAGAMTAARKLGMRPDDYEVSWMEIPDSREGRAELLGAMNVLLDKRDLVRIGMAPPEMGRMH